MQEDDNFYSIFGLLSSCCHKYLHVRVGETSMKTATAHDPWVISSLKMHVEVTTPLFSNSC